MKINGSIETRGDNNILPIDTNYNMKDQYTNLLLHFDEDTIYDLKDYSQYNSPIIKNGNPILDTSTKKIGKSSLKLDGSSSLIIPNGGKFTFDGQFTIHFWMNSTYITRDSIGSTAPRLLSMRSDGVTSTSTSSLEILSNSTDYNIHVWYGSFLTGTIAAFDGNWNHIAVTRDINNVIRLFVNGQLSISATNSNVFFGNFHSIVIGQFQNTIYGGYSGYIDEFVIVKNMCLWSDTFTPPSEQIVLNLNQVPSYSGVSTTIEVEEPVKKYDLLTYNYKTRKWKKTDENNIPAKLISLNDSTSTCDTLKFGTFIRIPENEKYDYVSILPNITSNVYNGYYIRPSSEYSDALYYQAWKCLNNPRNRPICAFDSYYDYWYLGSGQWNFINWLKIQLPTQKTLKSYTIYGGPTIASQGPISWKLKASNDGTNWVALDIRQNQPTWSAGESRTYTIYNIESYLYYMFFDFSMIGFSELYLYDIDGDDMIPNMATSTPIDDYTYTLDGYTITWNQHYSTVWSGKKLFLKNEGTNDGWYTTSTAASSTSENLFVNSQPEGAILDIILPNPRKIDVISIYPLPTGRGYCSFNTNFKLYGSNDCGFTFDLLYTNTDILSTDDIQQYWPKYISIDISKSYYQYRFTNVLNATWGVELLVKNKKYATSGNGKYYISKYNPGQLLPNKPTDFDKFNEQQIGTISNIRLCSILESQYYNCDTIEIPFVDFNSIPIINENNNLGDVTLSSDLSPTSDLDGDMVTLIYNNLTINSGITLTPSNRCRGFRIVVLNDCVINGTVSMTGKGANCQPDFDGDYPIYDIYNNIIGYVPKIGSAGAPALDFNGSGQDGSAGINGSSGGGGGGGGANFITFRGGGGAGTCFSGGAGGGGYAWGSGTTNASGSINGRDYGGRGGDGYYAGYADSSNTYYCRGGVGNPGGSEWYRTGTFLNTAPSGTGGLLILIVYGNLTIGSTGIISSDGISARTGSTYCLGGGGGSGGGSINIFYKGNLDNSGSIHANGGIGTQTTYSSNSYQGGNGGAGSIRFFQL